LGDPRFSPSSTARMRCRWSHLGVTASREGYGLCHSCFAKVNIHIYHMRIRVFLPAYLARLPEVRRRIRRDITLRGCGASGGEGRWACSPRKDGRIACASLCVFRAPCSRFPSGLVVVSRDFLPNSSLAATRIFGRPCGQRSPPRPGCCLRGHIKVISTMPSMLPRSESS
jgi:hypothetical protein